VSVRILLLLTYSTTCNILSNSSQLDTKCQGAVRNLFMEGMLVQTVWGNLYLLYDSVAYGVLAEALISEASNSLLGNYQRWIAEESSRE